MARVQVDKRGGIVLFKETTQTPAKVKGKPSITTIKYITFPVDHVGDAEHAKEFKTLAAARSTMPPIPNTTPKTLSKADQEALRLGGKRK